MLEITGLKAITVKAQIHELGDGSHRMKLLEEFCSGFIKRNGQIDTDLRAHRNSWALISPVIG